jgi:hypothetical protein
LVWLGLPDGLKKISRRDKYFFHFFKNIFERQSAGACRNFRRGGPKMAGASPLA